MGGFVNQILAQVGEAAEQVNEAVEKVGEAVEQVGDKPWNMTGIFWLLLIVFAAFFLLRATSRRLARSQADKYLSVQERVNRKVKGQDRVVSQMNELMAALADLSRQINGQIDTRLAKLEVLLSQADETIAKLDGVVGGRKRSVKAGQGRGGETEGAKGAVASSAAKEIHEISESFHGSMPISPESREVLELAEKGLSKIEIAGELHRPVGEIELILALAGKKGVIGGQE